MAISSPGVGSRLDVNSIVSQLVAIEKQPLQVKASKLQAQLSLYGTLKSQVIDLIHRWRAGVLGIGREVSNLSGQLRISVNIMMQGQAESLPNARIY